MVISRMFSRVLVLIILSMTATDCNAGGHSQAGTTALAVAEQSSAAPDQQTAPSSGPLRLITAACVIPHPDKVRQQFTMLSGVQPRSVYALFAASEAATVADHLTR